LEIAEVTCHCDRGFVCEHHPDCPDGHDGCRAEGVRCPNPDCPWWQGEAPAALDPAVFFEGRVVELPERAGPMLKAGAPLRWRRAHES
jgi:hypothetical protein